MALWNNTDTDASKPKYLSDDLRNTQSVSDKDATVGLSIDEAKNSQNVAKGLNTPGWVTYRTYTDSAGRTRHKSEVLVAMGSITGDNDALPPNTSTITITEQPEDDTVVTGDAANFAVDYESSNESISATHVWQVSVNGGTSWTTISGETGFDLQIASTSPNYLDGNQFRALITAGTTVVTSDVATLTITAE
jgi:hypothetical protein